MAKKESRQLAFLVLAYGLTYGVFRLVFAEGGIYPLFTPGWTARHFLWFAALVSVGAAWRRLPKTALLSFVGFLLGNLLGEIFGGSWREPPQFHHYGWLIAIGIFFLSVLIGYLLDRREQRKPM